MTYKMPEDEFFESALNAINKKDVNVFYEGYKRRKIYAQDLLVLQELGKTRVYTKNLIFQNTKNLMFGKIA